MFEIAAFELHPFGQNSRRLSERVVERKSEFIAADALIATRTVPEKVSLGKKPFYFSEKSEESEEFRFQENDVKARVTYLKKY